MIVIRFDAPRTASGKTRHVYVLFDDNADVAGVLQGTPEEWAPVLVKWPQAKQGPRLRITPEQYHEFLAGFSGDVRRQLCWN